MVQLDKTKIKEFVENNIKTFHESRLRNLENTKLKDLLKKMLCRTNKLPCLIKFVNCNHFA